MSDSGLKLRFLVSAFILMLAMTGLGVRLAFLHIYSGKKVDERRFKEKILAGRGTIYDCKGRENILAINLPVKDVCANPSVIVKEGNVIETASVLAETLDLPVDIVAVKINKPDRQYARIKRFVFDEKVEQLKQSGIPGLFYRDATVRHYPQNMFMCHILGFVNHQGIGSAGVEQKFDKYLRGSPGILEGRINALRQEVYSKRGRYIPALEGAAIYLTVDQQIQYMVERELDEVMKEHSAKAAWAIVQRVKTGEILAMASRPGYDLNRFRSADKSAFLNRAIGVVYEPGSTFKVGVIAAAIDAGIVGPEDVFDCENGTWFFAGRSLRDSHSYGNLSVADILKKSSNIGTAKIAIKMGEKRLYKYLRDFGFGKQTGIELPGEEMGILHPVSRWSKISISRIPIGQGVSVTGLQMLGVVSAVANDGILMKPYIVRQVIGSDGVPLYSSEPRILARPISYETSVIMRKLMKRVTEDGGTGRRARVEGFHVGGKTGTAQKAVDGSYSSSAYMASFVGFIPMENPELAILVVVDEPQPSHSGGTVSGPVFSRIAEQAVRYLNVKPDLLPEVDEDELVSAVR